MELAQIWIGLALAGYVLVAALLVLERWYGRRQEDSIRSRLAALRAPPPPPILWPEAPPPPPRSRFGRRPPWLITPGVRGGLLIEGHAERMTA